MKILEVLTDKRCTGNLGERAAAKHLKKSGYRIVKRNLVSLGYEIDIVATNAEYLVFCEVKTRTIKDGARISAASAVTPEKQRQIIAAARPYAAKFKENRKIRFDCIEVYLDDTPKSKKIHSINHMVGAFTGDTAYRKG